MECYTIFNPHLWQLIPHESIIESNLVHKNTYCYLTCSTNHSRLLSFKQYFLSHDNLAYLIFFTIQSKSGFCHEPYVKIVLLVIPCQNHRVFWRALKSWDTWKDTRFCLVKHYFLRKDQGLCSKFGLLVQICFLSFRFFVHI